MERGEESREFIWYREGKIELEDWEIEKGLRSWRRLVEEGRYILGDPYEFEQGRWTVYLTPCTSNCLDMV